MGTVRTWTAERSRSRSRLAAGPKRPGPCGSSVDGFQTPDAAATAPATEAPPTTEPRPTDWERARGAPPATDDGADGGFADGADGRGRGARPRTAPAASPAAVPVPALPWPAEGRPSASFASAAARSRAREGARLAAERTDAPPSLPLLPAASAEGSKGGTDNEADAETAFPAGGADRSGVAEPDTGCDDSTGGGIPPPPRAAAPPRCCGFHAGFSFAALPRGGTGGDAMDEEAAETSCRPGMTAPGPSHPWCAPGLAFGSYSYGPDAALPGAVPPG
jgi:hypothetical protein